MNVGIQISRFTWPEGPSGIAPTLERVARDADAGGFYSLWVMDHFFQITHIGPPELDMLEGYTTLGFIAGITQKVRLGTLVTGVAYRHPGILVKTVTTLDVLSGGRAFLGIGAAWNDEEARGLGIPFPPLGERFERLEETLRIAQQMWAGDETAIAGAHYQLERPLNVPQSLQRPHPPILIGGSGEQRTLRLVARYADACNLFGAAGPEVARHKLEVLRAHCEAEGRDYAEIEKTALVPVTVGDASGGLESIRALAGEGISHVMLSCPQVHEPGAVEWLAREIVGPAAEIEPAA